MKTEIDKDGGGDEKTHVIGSRVSADNYEKVNGVPGVTVDVLNAVDDEVEDEKIHRNDVSLDANGLSNREKVRIMGK